MALCMANYYFAMHRPKWAEKMRFQVESEVFQEGKILVHPHRIGRITNYLEICAFFPKV